MGPEVRASDEKETLVPASYDEFRNWLIGYVDDVWGIPDSLDLNGNIDFESLGMDSLEAHMMASLIEDAYGISFEPMLLLEYPTLNELARHCT